MKKEMTTKIILTDEILKDEQLDNVKGAVAPFLIAIGEVVAKYAVAKVAEIAVNEFSDKTIPNNAAPNFKLMKADFMPK